MMRGMNKSILGSETIHRYWFLQKLVKCIQGFLKAINEKAKSKDLIK